MKQKEYSNKDIHDLITEMGLKLCEHNHVWSNCLRFKFERITSYLRRIDASIIGFSVERISDKIERIS